MNKSLIGVPLAAVTLAVVAAGLAQAAEPAAALSDDQNE
jgi:hypothetical protein